MKKLFQNFEDQIQRTEKRLGNEVSSIIYLLIFVFTNSLILFYFKLHRKELVFSQCQLFRGFFLLASIHLYTRIRGIPFLPKISKSQVPLLIIRSLIAGSFHITLAYISTKTPGPLISILQSTIPFWKSFLSRCYYKTAMSRQELIFLAPSIIGSIFVINPDLWSTVQQVQGLTDPKKLFWMICAFVIVILWSASIVLFTPLGNLNTIEFNVPLGICMIGASLVGLSFEGNKGVSSHLSLQFIMVFGFLALISQYANIKTYLLGKPGIFLHLNFVLGSLLERYYFRVIPDTVSLLGIVLIVGSCTIRVVYRLRLAEKKKM